MRWIFTIIGFFITRKFWGGILGYIIGYLFEKQASKNQQPHFQQTTNNTHFELNLLSLCAIVIKADGRTTQQELDYVRMKFVEFYGQEKANAVFRSFNNIVKHQQVSVEEICTYIRYRSSYEMRLEILHFLFHIAKVDGKITDLELFQIERIARNFRLSAQDFESIKAMFFESGDDAYKILDISPNATDAEIKKAYREMAKKYHPDRVITDDEAIRKGAEEKFKKVQQAYEKIQKERGI